MVHLLLERPGVGPGPGKWTPGPGAEHPAPEDELGVDAAVEEPERGVHEFTLPLQGLDPPQESDDGAALGVPARARIREERVVPDRVGNDALLGVLDPQPRLPKQGS